MSRNGKKATEEHERWSKEIRRGAATLAILSVIDKEQTYGYEVVKRLSERSETLLALEQGTVYPILRRLEKRDLLESIWNYDDPTKPKKYYAITDEGRQALNLMVDTWSVLSDEMDDIIKGDGHD